jgi:hypothetical protein
MEGRFELERQCRSSFKKIKIQINQNFNKLEFEFDLFSQAKSVFEMIFDFLQKLERILENSV